MIGSSQHQLAKFLSIILQPVLETHSSHCIKDSFTFARIIQKLDLDPKTTFLCSFNISSLFTNVPLDETIQICPDTLYNGDLIPPVFSKEIFIELMYIATKSVQFSFDNIMYQQIDGVAMGSPLGPALANIFVGFYENKLFNAIDKPLFYFRYVDDTFAIFNSESECNHFLRELNSLHPSLNFTQEMEDNNRLPFLDVLVEKTENRFLTSVYRKPTFTGQYNR